MPLPVIPGTVRCAVTGTVPSGQAFTNVWHARYAGGASTAGSSDIVNLDTLLSRMYSGTAFTSGSAWLPACTSGVTVNGITYTPLNATAIPTVIAKAFAGTATGNSSPSEVAMVLTLRTAVRGRSYRGRIYLPCPAVSQLQTNGNLGAASAALIVAQLAGVMAALGGASVAPFWEIGVASYKLSHFEPLSAGTMNVIPDVQKRRKA